MSDRYSVNSLSRYGDVIERVATDNNLWHTLTALHFVCEYSRQNRIFLNRAFDSCYKLLSSGLVNDRFLAGLLLWGLVKKMRSKKRAIILEQVKSVFGRGIASDIEHYIKQKQEPSISLFKRRIKSKAVFIAITELAHSRYELNRDGVALEKHAIDNGYWRMLRAIHYANKRHMGEVRKDGTPGIDHPFRICWDLHNRLGLIPGLSSIMELIFVVALLHDSIENTSATEREIGFVFGRKEADHVKRLSRKPGDKLDPSSYYQGIVKRIVCLLVKVVDKENIFGDMIVGLSAKRQMGQIKEVSDHLMPAMKVARKKYPLLRGIFFSCRNQMMRSILATASFRDRQGIRKIGSVYRKVATRA